VSHYAPLSARVFLLVARKDQVIQHLARGEGIEKAEDHCAVEGEQRIALLLRKLRICHRSGAVSRTRMRPAQKCESHPDRGAQLIARTAANSHEGWNLLTTWSPDPDWTGDRPGAPVCTSKNLTPAPLSAVTEDERAG